MRLAPNTDTVPATVNRYLLPHEGQVISVHQHPAVLIRPIFETLAGLAIAGWVSNSVAHGTNWVILVIWILWALLLLRLLWKVFDWSQDYLAVTSQRLLLAQGFLTRKVNMMPLAKVTDMSFQRSPMGQLLGYGEFIVESAGQDQALRNVDHLPYPRAAVSRGLRADLQGEGRKQLGQSMFMSVVMVDRHKPESDPVPCLSRNSPPHAAAVGQRSEVHRIGRRGPWQVPAYTVLGQHQTRRHAGGRPPAGACARAASWSWRRGPTQPGLGRIARRASPLRAMPGLRGNARLVAIPRLFCIKLSFQGVASGSMPWAIEEAVFIQTGQSH
jgi:membrane protein YdbS with pleckstrin-like domain